MASRSKEHWLQAARRRLLRGGVGAVRVETLARDLAVTKGSFYWHFQDRADLLEALLAEWEAENELLSEALRHAQPLKRLPAILDELGRRNVASERGESPSDAAICAWAAADPAVGKRVNKVERKRMSLFRALTGDRDLADLIYYAYHGFLLRRHRVPSAAGDFVAISRVALRLLRVDEKRAGANRRPQPARK